MRLTSHEVVAIGRRLLEAVQPGSLATLRRVLERGRMRCWCCAPFSRQASESPPGQQGLGASGVQDSSTCDEKYGRVIGHGRFAAHALRLAASAQCRNVVVERCHVVGLWL